MPGDYVRLTKAFRQLAARQDRDISGYLNPPMSQAIEYVDGREVSIESFLMNMRSTSNAPRRGLVSHPPEDLTAELERFGLFPYRSSVDSKWRLERFGQRDSDYAAVLNEQADLAQGEWPPIDLDALQDRYLTEIQGRRVWVDLEAGLFRLMREDRRREPLSEDLQSALARYGRGPVQQPGGKWRLERLGERDIDRADVMADRAHLARSLGEVVLLPVPGELGYTVVAGQAAKVEIGDWIAMMQSTGQLGNLKANAKFVGVMTDASLKMRTAWSATATV